MLTQVVHDISYKSGDVSVAQRRQNPKLNSYLMMFQNNRKIKVVLKILDRLH